VTLAFAEFVLSVRPGTFGPAIVPAAAAPAAPAAPAATFLVKIFF